MDVFSVYPEFIEPGREVDVWADIVASKMIVTGSVMGGNIYTVADVTLCDK